MSKFLGKALALSLSAILMTACTTTDTSGDADQQLPTPTVDTGTTTTIEEQRRIDEETTMRKDRETRTARTIYFDLDRHNIKMEYRALLQAHALYLSKHPTVNVKLEGHADERGTPEYNIALGERRAKVIADLFSSSGVSDSQMETISYGEEKPVAHGHNENSWSKNRRVEIIYRD